MNRYTISNDEGKETTIMLRSHRQHIWSESHAEVSAAVMRRVRSQLGAQDHYGNPRGNFGQAQRVYLHLAD